ncbi:hypothetical protein [Pelagibius sp. Alg239-R121]|uniref:hypothetical protein n=1 Tax=Pelagibius sp. Alg239-R121 TaxID=2993448 RepID=UPI0024A633A8|nr:hypothetical protein [Pelagibius sp. Alg239-R121]
MTDKFQLSLTDPDRETLSLYRISNNFISYGQYLKPMSDLVLTNDSFRECGCKIRVLV